MAEFLLEIGTEEIPARMIASATEELARRVREFVEREHLAAKPKIESFSTPRRIAVLLRGLNTTQPDIDEQVMGPAVKVAYKDGQPTPAAAAFAKKVGLDLAEVQQVSTPKGDYLCATVTRKGRPAAELLGEAIPKEISALYWAKNMYWRAGKPERFVRPLRWLVSLLDDKVIPVEFAGVTAGKTSRGHRILAEGEVTISSPSAYAAELSRAYVVPTYAQREAVIRKALDAAVRAIPGARWREDKALLDTVVNLTEFPSVILGNFDPEYLTLPEEVLVTVMRDHQKYFAVEDANGKLAPHFLAVLNTADDPDGLIRHGNERVLRARFNDARFFWDTDQKINLRERVELLKTVTFQKDLGSYYDKAMRVQKLASLVCAVLKNADVAVRPGIVHKAALMAKTDLTAELVKEFTELQGIIGGLYAKTQAAALEFDPVVGDAIYDQYKPESMDDDVPRTKEGAVLALADKADTIAGMFALGLIPSGSKDPFALRRAANGIVRIIAEHNLPLSLEQVMGDALIEYRGSEAEKRFTLGDKYAGEVAAFFRERAEFYLREAKGFAYDVVNAVLESGADDVVDVLQRATAVAAVRGSDDFDAISASFKRIKNILRQAGKLDGHHDAKPLSVITTGGEAAEMALITQTVACAEALKQLRMHKKYDEALTQIATIRKPLDEFFDKIMVMAEDKDVRERRLHLLQVLFLSFSQIADFSEIVTERKG
jgi:glycyl-tRNA synthetase beta chain